MSSDRKGAILSQCGRPLLGGDVVVAVDDNDNSDSNGLSSVHATAVHVQDKSNRFVGGDGVVPKPHLRAEAGPIVAGSSAYHRGPTRRLSWEFFTAALILTIMLGNGFRMLASDSRRLRPHLVTEMADPHWFFAMFGSVALDMASDLQLHAFLFHFKSFVLLYAAIGAASQLLRWLGAPAQRQRLRVGAFVSRRPWLLPALHAIVGVIFCIPLHGPHVFIPFTIMLANFWFFKFLQRQRWCPYWLFMTIMWTTHTALLYVNYRCEGYERVYWLQKLLPSSMAVHARVVGFPRPPLWKFRMRWFLNYRLYVLRMIAFNYDMWEAHRLAAVARERAISKHARGCVDCAKLRERVEQQLASKRKKEAVSLLPRRRSQGSNSALDDDDIDAHKTRIAAGEGDVCVAVTQQQQQQEDDGDGGDGEQCWCYKLRTEHPRGEVEYSLLNYVAFMVYTPTLLTGPISSFNAFVSHLRVATAAAPFREHMVPYVIRLVGVFVCIKALLHFIFVVAFSADVERVLTLTVSMQSFVMYYYLAYLWMKFAFLWRCSRLFSLWCGVEVPENMRRCFSNTFSVRDFWRDWHASFNLWIVRYMYIPMGGRQRIAFSVFPIFFFIAVWHDHALHLLKWALCIVVMFILELAVSAGFRYIEGNLSIAIAAMAVETRQSEQPHQLSGGENREAAKLSNGRRPGRLSRIAAAAVLRWLTPPQRYWLRRVVVIAGGACTVFSLIVANLIGYNVQRRGEAQGSVTDRTIGAGLLTAPMHFYVGLALTMFAAAWHGLMDREMKAQQLEEDRRRYGLAAPTQTAAAAVVTAT